MQSILVLNSKGGSGKTTIATNLAGYYAAQGSKVAIADYDPQGSSLDWLAVRPAQRPHIQGIDASSGSARSGRSTDVLVMDAPSGIAAQRLRSLLQKADQVIMPVLPSPLDTRAASRFLSELLRVPGVQSARTRVATVANRVREGTRAADDLEDYLEEIRLPDGRRVPYATLLRASQNYIRAAERGLSIFEFAPYATLVDREQWRPLLQWLQRRRRGR